MLLIIIVSLVLAIWALAFVFYPLYRPRLGPTLLPLPSAQSQAEQDEVGELGEREQNARTALQEVELDYQLGNITEPDYRALRERYMQRALVALKSRYAYDQDIDDEIEAQLRNLKESHEEAND